jgi:hypothetical protein
VRPPFAPAVRQFSAGPFLPSTVLPFRRSLEKQKTDGHPPHRRPPPHLGPGAATAPPHRSSPIRYWPAHATPTRPSIFSTCPRHPHTSCPSPAPSAAVRRYPPLSASSPADSPFTRPTSRRVRSGAHMCEILYDFVVSRGCGNPVRFCRRPYDSTVSRGRGHLPWTPPSSIPAAIFIACGCRQRRLGTRSLVSSNPALKVRLIPHAAVSAMPSI